MSHQHLAATLFAAETDCHTEYLYDHHQLLGGARDEFLESADRIAATGTKLRTSAGARIAALRLCAEHSAKGANDGAAHLDSVEIPDFI
ncbi:hypothetical protein ABQE45_24030 [Mycobacteroides chelonae]